MPVSDPPADERRVYSVQEAAEVLGVTANAIRKAEGRGRLPKASRDDRGARFYYSDDLARMRTVLD